MAVWLQQTAFKSETRETLNSYIENKGLGNVPTQTLGHW